MHDLYHRNQTTTTDMQQQSTDNKQNSNSIFPRVFLYSAIDAKDEVEEKLDRARAALGRLVGNLSEREAHDTLTNASFQNQKHDEICLGLLGTILTEPALAPKCFRDMTFLSRDLGIIIDTLTDIVINKYQKLTDVSRSQLLWMIKEMVKGSLNGAESLCWNIMRQIAGGDISGRNLWLSETMLDIYSDNSGWLDKYPVLIAAVIYTYLRILEDHNLPQLSNIRQKEVNFVVNLIREHFTDVIMNQQIGLGRDFLRVLQAVARIPEIELIWRDIYYNPKALSPHLSGVTQLLNLRTSRKYLLLRLTPDMEKKLAFLTANVKFGLQKRYQEWFQRQYLSTPESQTLRADLIRFIVGVIHPPNEILCSDILPRWAVIGWLLTTCTNPVAAANAKLALFYDWLLFDAAKDNIMNIEPGILVMHHSLKPHLAITTTLLDFLIRLTYEYLPAYVDKIKAGIGAALKTILVKKVLPSLDFILENPKFEPELRNAIQEHLIVLLDRNNGTKIDAIGSVGVPSITNSVIVTNNNSENHIMESTLTLTPPPSATATTPNYVPPSIPLVSSPNVKNNSDGNLFSTSITSRASPPLPTASISLTPPSPVSGSNSSISFYNFGPQSQLSVPSSNTPSITSAKLPTNSDRGMKMEILEQTKPEYSQFSDDDDDDPMSENTLIPKMLAGTVPTRSSPTLGSSVEEAEKSQIFDFAQTFPTAVRLAVEGLMIDRNLTNRKDYLEDIIEELCETPIEVETRERISKCFLYLFKSELSKPCVNEDNSSVIENLTISPVSELLLVLWPIKPSDKSLKTKNLTRVLVDIIFNQPSIGYKILIILYQSCKREKAKGNTKREENFPSLYKNLAAIRGFKLEAQLIQDMKCCWENEPLAVGYLCPVIYTWYETECLATSSNSCELLHLVTSTLDSFQLQELVWKVMQGDLNLLNESSLKYVIQQSLEWETWEQHCLWTLIEAHNFDIEECSSVIPQLDVKNNSEALTALLIMLKREKPNQDILAHLFCRKASPRDHFVLTLLLNWSSDFEDELAEILTAVLVRASGSPVKRKRGPTGARGIASPGGPSTPTVEGVLAHLDQLREHTTHGEGIFAKDIMQAALLQVQSWVNDSQKNKYKELLALAAEEPDSKESRSVPKRSATSRKLTSSPTPTAQGNSSSSTIVNTSSNTTSSGSTNNPTLSRTRSGRTRTPLKDESSETSDEDDEVPRPKKVKRRKHATAFNSDSD